MYRVVRPLPSPIAGATAPISLAGALAQQNAEVLGSVVLAQLVQPGLPIIYCGRLAMMEPRTGVSVWGGVELGVVSAATVQLGHRYGLPVNVYGFSTNAHTLEIQNGYERAFNASETQNEFEDAFGRRHSTYYPRYFWHHYRYYDDDFTRRGDTLADACVDHYVLLGSDDLSAGAGGFVEVASGPSTSFTGNPPYMYYLVVAEGAGGQRGPLGHFGQ